MKKTFLPIIVLGLMIPPVLAYSTYREGLTVSPVPITESTEPTESTDILGATDDYPENQIYFTVNIPATFNEDISAPNIVYSVNGDSGEIVIDNRLVAGSGISVDGRTITNTGILTLVAGTGITVDGSTITNSGITSLSAGTNISIDGSTITNTYTFTPDYTSSGWTDNGSTVTLTTTTDSVTVADFTSDGITITNANSILPDTDLGSDLGSTTLRFNNLWVANINSNSSQSFSGQTTFSYPPTDTTIDEASVLINPTTSAASGQLLGLAIAGYQKALIDEDGDIILGYSDATSAPASDYPLNIYGHSGTRVSFVDTSGNAYFAGNVGIGTTGPGAKLEINGDFKVTKVDTPSRYVKIWHGGSDSAIDVVGGGSLNLMPSFANGNVILRSTGVAIGDASGDAHLEVSANGTTGGNIFLLSSNDDNDGDLLTVKESGNVGIGTTDPGAKLHVSGGYPSLAIQNTTGTTDTWKLYAGVLGYNPDIFTISKDGTYSRNALLINDSNNIGIDFLYGTQPLSKLGINGNVSIGAAYDTVAAPTNGLIVEGNVGIGTTDPGYTLDVNGTTRSTAYRLTSGYWDASTLSLPSAGSGYYRIMTSSQPLVFWTTGAESMRLDAAGNLGIGTTAPQSLLDVQGDAGAAGILTLASKELTVVDGDILGRINFNAPLESDGTDSLLVGASIWAEADDTFSTTVNSTELVFGTGTSATATEAMRIDSAGNVGIGTTGPISKLQIGLNIESSPNIPTVAGFYSSTDSSMIFRIGRDTTTPRTLSFGASDASGYAEIQAFQSKTSWSNTPLVLQRQGGNVGIGTAEPGAKLDVSEAFGTNTNAINITNTSAVAANNSGIINITANTNPMVQIRGLAELASGAKGALAFSTYNSGFGERMRIDSSGNVGIGTTDPGTTLDVVGTVTISTLTTGTVYSNSGVLTNTDPSDENLKNNILTLEDGTLDKLLGLRPVSFDWKSTGDGALGFIAQEVDQVFPELVGSNSDGTLGLYTTQFIPVLAKAIQEQQLEIDGLSSATGSAQLVEIEESVGILEGLIAEIRDWVMELQGKWTELAEEFTTKKSHQETLCIGESTDDETCLSKDQIDQLIELLPSPTLTPDPSSTPEPSEPPDPTPSPEPSPDPEATGSATP